MICMEEFSKYKLYFEEFQNRVADFEELKSRAANITVDSVRICLKEKQGRNENNQKDDCRVNPSRKSETNKSAGETRANKRKMQANKRKMQEKSKTRVNKLKCVRPIQQYCLTSTIHHYCPLRLGNIPLRN